MPDVAALNPKMLLEGDVPAPTEASPLYDALVRVFENTDEARALQVALSFGGGGVETAHGQQPDPDRPPHRQPRPKLEEGGKEETEEEQQRTPEGQSNGD